MKSIYIYITFSLLTACDDRKSSTTTYLINNTDYLIEILPFNYGVMDSTAYKTLAPKEKNRVFSASPWGKTLSPNWGLMNQWYDSIIVIFNANPIKQTIHLSWRDSTISCENCLNYYNNKNLSNPINYEITIQKNVESI
jgi:hypothetical protein